MPFHLSVYLTNRWSNAKAEVLSTIQHTQVAGFTYLKSALVQQRMDDSLKKFKKKFKISDMVLALAIRIVTEQHCRLCWRRGIVGETRAHLAGTSIVQGWKRFILI